MGYTHYWHDTQPFTASFLADVRAVLAAVPRQIELLHEYDEPGTAPLVSEETIRFNGAGRLGHETFALDPSDAGDYSRFGVCKTAKNPYDVAVVAVLALAAEAGIARVSSDGGPEDWQDGVALASAATGRQIPCPIKG